MAIVAPILFLLVGGIIQFGLIFWSEQTLTQIARDTGRWAATQTSCSDRAAVASTANTIAGNSSLFGYGSNWAASASDTSSSSEIVVDWDTISGVMSARGQPGSELRLDHDRPSDPAVLPLRPR